MDSWSYGSMSGFEQGLSYNLENHDGASCVEENQSSNLSKIDFKLRSFMGYENHEGTLTKAKKTRPLTPLCQVYGCNMDLSLSKDYHKRHRVCEAHSKTSVVIVSGIEQRFCQQCSRFHFLSEFDDGKRSCRRRLAGHNERRRKPSFYFLQSKRHKLLTQESFPGSFLYKVMDEHDHRASRLVSFRDEPMFPGEDRVCESRSEASGVSYIWDLQEAVPRSTCALSLLSAQSQQHLSETPNKSFSITQPNQNFNHSTVDYHQMQPLRIDPGKKTKSGSSSCNGKGSSTVNLLQLSSHLQRIQQQQRSFTDEVKQEYNEFYIP